MITLITIIFILIGYCIVTMVMPNDMQKCRNAHYTCSGRQETKLFNESMRRDVDNDGYLD
jgi:hypothetical protein